jgi:hypothetical protein
LSFLLFWPLLKLLHVFCNALVKYDMITHLLKPVSQREIAIAIEMALHRHMLDKQLKEHKEALRGYRGADTDITERKLVETYWEMGRNILLILNETGDFHDSIRLILAELKTKTGIDSVAIRLQEGDDYPYCVEEGFSRDFLRTENSLAVRDADGRVCRDKNGKVKLECSCGKVAIPDSILFKPDKLTEGEFDEMKKHCYFGYEAIRKTEELLGEISFLSFAKEITRSHHEKWDGSGYPQGLKGEEIPLTARIMAVADVYDALVSERPYKRPFSHEKAMQIIEEGSGSHFDPQLVKIFVENHDVFNTIAKNFRG